MRCERAQELVAAAVDDELAPRRRRALDRHLAGCEVCRRELGATERLLGMLDALPMEAEVSVDLEQATLRRVRLLAADESEKAERTRWTRWLPLPAFAVATAAVTVLAIGVMRYAGETSVPASIPSAPVTPDRVASATTPPAPKPSARTGAPRMTEPPAELPPKLAAAPDLFMDLPILRNMEKLEHFEAIQTTTLDDETPSGEEPPSNG
jgi:anti-sigma factor RsiW